MGSGAPVATTPSTFWSVDALTRCATCLSSNASVGVFLNETPFTWLRYGGGSDECNATTNTVYSSNGVASNGCEYNLTSLRAWCDSLTPNCHALLTLPGENNNSAEDAAIAKWIVSTLGFQPDYWAIGNEPTGWTHYGIPWTSWSSSDASSATPLAYAFDVKAAIKAVSAVDPGAKFIGLEAACSCNTAWFQDVAMVDGSAISAIAYHSYPSNGSSNPTLSEFYAPLSGPSNLSSTYAGVRSTITAACPGCARLPLFVNEYNAGPGWSPSNLAGTYPNAVFLAASVTQALRENVSQLTMFDLQTGSTGSYGYAMLGANGTVGPTGTLFTQVLSHLAVGTVVAGGLTAPFPGVWSVVTRNSTDESLLVTSTNLSQAVSFSTSGSFLAGATGVAYEWSPALAFPNMTRGAIAGSYSVPAQGILLLTVRVGAVAPPPGAWAQWLPNPLSWPQSPNAPTLAVALPGSGRVGSGPARATARGAPTSVAGPSPPSVRRYVATAHH
jgi:hypothetical protein